MMYLFIILLIAVLGGLIWLQQKQEREWLAEMKRTPLEYKQPLAATTTHNTSNDDDTIEILDEPDSNDTFTSETHATTEAETFLLDDENEIPVVVTENTHTAVELFNESDSNTFDLSEPASLDGFAEPVDEDDFLDDIVVETRQTPTAVPKAPAATVIEPLSSVLPFELIDDEPIAAEKQPENATHGPDDTHFEAEIITFEDATHNLLDTELSSVVTDKWEDTAITFEENDSVISAEMGNESPFQAAFTNETEFASEISHNIELETITLDDPALNRVRSRTLNELVDFGTTVDDAMDMNSLFGEVRLPEPQGELETIDIQDIQDSLSRQHAARLHQQRTPVAPVADTAPSYLDVIPEDEIWTNLSHTQIPAARKRQQDNSAPTRFTPQANRLSGTESFTAASPVAGVAIADVVSVPNKPFPAPEIVEPVSFDNALRPEDFASNFFVNGNSVHPISTGVSTQNTVVPEPQVEDDSPFTEADFKAHYREQAEESWANSWNKQWQEEVEMASQTEQMQPENTIPPLSLLHESEYNPEVVQSTEMLDNNSRTIEEKLAEYRVKVNVVDAYAGPVITRYEIEPDVGVRGSAVINLEKDLARSLGVAAIRVVETIPGKTCMGLELPNPKRQIIRLSEIFNSPAFKNSHSKLTLALGQDITGEPVVTDLAKAPHLLVAGTTGSGKSVGVNAMILSMLYKANPEDVRMIMIDPKMLELSIYEGIPHLLAPVVTDMKLAANALNWCVNEMEKRYRLMSHIGVRNLAGYNDKIQAALDKGTKIPNPFSFTPDDPEPLEKLPFIVVIVDEFADLMMVSGKQIEQLIARLAQKARAAGIHLILATQRPSVDVITGLIKANIPTRIAFQVSSKIDSRTILDQMGAENLLGQGDMLFLPPGTSYPQRVHGAFVADSEVHAIVEYLKQFGEPDYIDDILTPETEEYGVTGSASGERDPLFDQAVEAVTRSKKATISSLQRHLRIGYNKAATIIEQLEAEGIVSAPDQTGKRKVLARSSD